MGAEKVTYTTSLDRKLKDDFKIYCAINGKKQNEILEDLISNLIYDNNTIENDISNKKREVKKTKKEVINNLEQEQKSTNQDVVIENDGMTEEQKAEIARSLDNLVDNF